MFVWNLIILASSKREENSVQNKKEKPVTIAVKPKKNFADLENALDKLIKTMSKEANEKDEQKDSGKKEENKDKQEVLICLYFSKQT